MVKPSKIIFLIDNTEPKKEDIILLYKGYHSIPKSKYYSDVGRAASSGCGSA